MGHPHGFDFTGAEDIWNEIRAGLRRCARNDATRGSISAGLQWPCPNETHPGTPILHVDAFASGARAPLRIVEYHATLEQTTPKYPFVLTTGRSLYQFNAGTMTGRCRTQELRPSDVLEIAAADADTADICDGDVVRLISRYGSATMPIHVSAAMREGELFATFHTAKTFLNSVTTSYGDRTVGTPEYKVTAVRLEKV